MALRGRNHILKIVILGGAILPQVDQQVLHPLKGSFHGGVGVDNNLKAQLLQLGVGEEGRIAALHQVYQGGDLQLLGDAGKLFLAPGGLHKDDVRPSLGVGVAPADGLVQAAGGGDGIGAGYQHQVRVHRCLAGSPELLAHLLNGDYHLILKVAAAFGGLLVLQNQGAHIQAGKLPNGAVNIEGGAVAVVNIHNQGERGVVVNSLHQLQVFGHGDQVIVRQAKVDVRQASPCDKLGRKAGVLNQPGKEGGGHPRSDDNTRFCQHCPKSQRFFHFHSILS